MVLVWHVMMKAALRNSTIPVLQVQAASRYGKIIYNTHICVLIGRAGQSTTFSTIQERYCLSGPFPPKYSITHIHCRFPMSCLP